MNQSNVIQLFTAMKKLSYEKRLKHKKAIESISAFYESRRQTKQGA